MSNKLQVASLDLLNYRNIHSLCVSLSPFVNIIWGGNGHGKTNFLESLYLIATSRSFRADHDHELISWNAASCQVNASIFQDSRRLNIQAKLFLNPVNERAKKQFWINHTLIKKLSTLTGVVPMVLFTPEDLEIVKGSPAARRAFLDLILAQTSPSYADAIQRYQSVVEQRNRLLKEKGERISKSEITPWNIQMAKNGSIILEKRLLLIKNLEPLIKDASTTLSCKKETISLIYRSTISHPNISCLTVKEIENLFLEELEKHYKEETERRQSIIGPHRDDFIVYLNSYPIRSFGSQGQQRSAALTLKFAEWHYINQIIEIPPILLLDDLFSELDNKRGEALLQLIDKTGQTFITTTEPSFTALKNNASSIAWFKIVEGESHVLTA